MIADCLVIFAVHASEKAMRAQKELQQLKAEKENSQHEQEKVNAKAMKKMDRDAQKQQQSRDKRQTKGNSAFGSTYTIQQPKSKGS
jgi:hypothetical protein